MLRPSGQIVLAMINNRLSKRPLECRWDGADGEAGEPGVGQHREKVLVLRLASPSVRARSGQGIGKEQGQGEGKGRAGAVGGGEGLWEGSWGLKKCRTPRTSISHRSS